MRVNTWFKTDEIIGAQQERTDITLYLSSGAAVKYRYQTDEEAQQAFKNLEEGLKSRRRRSALGRLWDWFWGG